MAFITRLIFALIGMAFAVLFACLRWLVTGQKPQVLLMWQQIQAMRKGMQAGQGATWSSWSRSSDGQWHQAQGRAQRSGDSSDVIEDVVVREIHHTHQLPKD
jgi:hypothetical protein